tara:strand:+ start:4452 stop:5738 length:1287 start_codon:yes stop_codon:yes gene_type:complete
MSASTQRLNYSQVPPRASSSRAIRNEIVPTNSGGSYTMNSQIIFDLPANLNNTFCDFQSSYIKATITNNDASAINFCGGGFPSCIKQIVLELGGQTLFSCDNWNTLYEMMLSLDTSASFRNNAGLRLFGAGGDFTGEPIAAGASRTVCFPLVLTPLMCNRYFPLVGRDRLRIRLILDTAAKGLIAGTTGILDSEIAISDVALVTYNLELGSDVMSMVAANSGGAFKIAMPSYQHHQASLSSSATSLVATVGFSMSSLNRILIAQQLQAVTDTSNSVGNRARLRLNRFFVTIGGVKYPMRDVQDLGTTGDAGAGAEPFAEALISQRALCAWSHDSSISQDGGFALQEDDGSTSAKTGSFLIDLDLESQRVAGGESSVGLVAGVNCIGQVVQLTMEYAASSTADHVVNVFGEHTILCSLDLNTLTWSIAV